MATTRTVQCKTWSETSKKCTSFVEALFSYTVKYEHGEYAEDAVENSAVFVVNDTRKNWQHC
jgi:hypothetical protein